MMSSIPVQRLTSLCLIAITALALNGCGSKDDPRLASPKSAARTLFQAMYDNDVVAAKSCVLAGPGQTELVEGMTKMVVAMRAANDAAFKRFGDEYAKLAGGSLDMAHIDSKQIDAGTEAIDGAFGTISLQHGKTTTTTTLHLVRIEGNWRVDMGRSFAPGVNLADRQMIRLVTSMFSGTARAADQTRADIEAGKYPSARPAVQALLANMRKAIEEEKNRAINEFAPR
jgi:hypothetical protein